MGLPQLSLEYFVHDFVGRLRWLLFWRLGSVVAVPTREFRVGEEHSLDLRLGNAVYLAMRKWRNLFDIPITETVSQKKLYRH